ncbi:MAG: hypothetical protein FWD47_12130 [Treponema sp.]|nr:hypothetical protein [Treponema sp.]
MKNWIINVIVLVLVAIGSFFLGILASGFISVPRNNVVLEETVQQGAVQNQEAEAEDESAVRQKVSFASFLFPEINSEKGLQNALNEKSAEILNIWEILKTGNGVISIIQAAHSGNTEFLSPIGSSMGKISDSLLWASAAVVFKKYLLFISSYIILIFIIPVFILISVVSIVKNKDRKKTPKLVGVTVFISLILLFVIPASMHISLFASNVILSDNMSNLITSIEEKGETVKNMETEITGLRRQGRSVLNHSANARDLGNSLIKDTTDYFIIFIFTNIIIPVLTIIGIVFLAGFIKKLILPKKA